LHLTYQKVVIKINNELLVTFITRFSINEILKILLSPSIASLNDYLAFKFGRTVKNRPHDLDLVKTIYKSYLNELSFSYGPFKTLVDMQYRCESLRPGPNMDNVSIVFEFAQTEYLNNPAEEIYFGRSFQLEQKEIIKKQLFKELIMIISYRRVFQVGLKVNKSP